jgi:hypothetical protein
MENFIRKEYPNAKPGAVVTDEYLGFLSEEYKADLKKMLFAGGCWPDRSLWVDSEGFPIPDLQAW